MQTHDIPSAEHVRGVLQGLTYAQTAKLSELSGVPFTTLWKVRNGETENPRLETVRALFAHLGEAAA